MGDVVVTVGAKDGPIEGEEEGLTEGEEVGVTVLVVGEAAKKFKVKRGERAEKEAKVHVLFSHTSGFPCGLCWASSWFSSSGGFRWAFGRCT